MKFEIKETLTKYKNYEEQNIIKGKAEYIEIDFSTNSFFIQCEEESHYISNFNNKKSTIKIYNKKEKIKNAKDM